MPSRCAPRVPLTSVHEPAPRLATARVRVSAAASRVSARALQVLNMIKIFGKPIRVNAVRGPPSPEPCVHTVARRDGCSAPPGARCARSVGETRTRLPFVLITFPTQLATFSPLRSCLPPHACRSSCAHATHPPATPLPLWPQASKDRDTIDVGANIFVGNLDPEVDEKLLYDTFSAFGVIVSTPKVMRDPDSGNSRGFGFVSFETFEASDAAIEAMNGQARRAHRSASRHQCNRASVCRRVYRLVLSHRESAVPWSEPRLCRWQSARRSPGGSSRLRASTRWWGGSRATIRMRPRLRRWRA